MDVIWSFKHDHKSKNGMGRSYLRYHRINRVGWPSGPSFAAQSADAVCVREGDSTSVCACVWEVGRHTRAHTLPHTESLRAPAPCLSTPPLVHACARPIPPPAHPPTPPIPVTHERIFQSISRCGRCAQRPSCLSGYRKRRCTASECAGEAKLQSAFLLPCRGRLLGAQVWTLCSGRKLHLLTYRV